MDILWEELAKEDKPSINQRVASSFLSSGPIITPTTLKGTITHLAEDHDDEQPKITDILKEENSANPLTLDSLQDTLAVHRARVFARHEEKHTGWAGHSHVPALKTETAAGAHIAATAEEEAQNKEHQPAYINDNGTYSSTCSCGWQSPKINKNTVDIDEDYTNPENLFSPEDVEKVRHDTASSASRAEFGNHARAFQKDKSFGDLSDIIDIRHNDAIQEEFSQRDLNDLLSETQGRPSGQAPIEDADRPEPINQGIYKDRSGLPRAYNLTQEVKRSVDKLQDFYEENGGTRNPDIRRTRTPQENLLSDLSDDVSPPDTPNRLPVDVNDTIKPSNRKK